MLKQCIPGTFPLAQGQWTRLASTHDRLYYLLLCPSIAPLSQRPPMPSFLDWFQQETENINFDVHTQTMSTNYALIFDWRERPGFSPPPQDIIES